MGTKSSIKSNTLIGIIVTLIGMLFLARNFGLFPNEYLAMLLGWQTIIIAIGTVIYINSNNKSVGVTLIVVGILGLIPEIWPVVLIAMGGYLIFNNKQSKNIDEQKTILTNESLPNQKINDISIFGGAKKTSHIENFTGGTITSIFGGSEINMMDSTLAEGTNKLEVFFIFGGSSLIVPRDWNVSIQTANILGGFKDRRRIDNSTVTGDSKQLVITGIILFGSGDLKN